MKLAKLKNCDPPFSVKYETRPRSAAYLANLDEAQKNENIDFFHMYEACRCIKEWFDAKGNRKQFVADKFYGYLYEWVNVMRYEAGPDVDSTGLLSRALR
jgi:hypothetical protein